jgi:hypothetical protein
MMMLRFDTRLVVVLEESLETWQKANVTAFLVSGIAATDPSTVGDPYEDASGNRYLPMFRQPVRVLATDAAGLRRAYERARERGVERLAIFTRELFATPHDEANRAAVKAVAADSLDLVGLALHADEKVVSKVTDKLRPHP